MCYFSCKKNNNNKTKPESGSKTIVLSDAHMRFNLTKFSNKVLKKIISFFSSRISCLLSYFGAPRHRIAELID